MGLHIAYHLTAGDFTTAGEASTGIKKQLRQLGIPSSVLRRIAVAAYEAELNLVIHSLGGDLTADVDAEKIVLRTIDCGPGIPDISLAMKEGYSTAGDEARSLGFGAGMGLPNMKKYTDEMRIESELNKGTTVYMKINAE